MPWPAARLVSSLPAGFERVAAVLPEHQAFIVKKWGEETRKKLEGVDARMQRREGKRRGTEPQRASLFFSR
jgi:hypothetical protein